VLASDPPAAHWPHEGAISFVDVSVVYRPGLPPAVVSFSAELRARERAAVVGRTGAGKSTLVPAALPWGLALWHAPCSARCNTPCTRPAYSMRHALRHVCRRCSRSSS